MFTPKGTFGWYELMTSDTKAAGKFYSDVVGWATQEMPGADGPQYTTFNLDNVGIAGMLNIPGQTAWIGYIAVDDVDAHIKKIVEAGGKLLKPATDVPGILRFAVMSDPQGAAIVVFTPNPEHALAGTPRTTDPRHHRLARALHQRSRKRIRLLQQALWLGQGQRYGHGTHGRLSHLR